MTVVAVLVGTTPRSSCASYVHATLVRYAPAEPVRRRRGPRGPGADPRRPRDHAARTRCASCSSATRCSRSPARASSRPSTSTGEVVASERRFPGWGIYDRPDLAGLCRHGRHVGPRRSRAYTTAGTGPRRLAPRGLPRDARRARRDVARCAGAAGVALPAVPADAPLSRADAARRRPRTPRPSTRGTRRRGLDARVAARPRACTSRSPRASSSTGASQPLGVAPARPERARGHLGPDPLGRRRAPVPAGHRRCTPRPSPRTWPPSCGLPSRGSAGGSTAGSAPPIVESGDQFCPSDHP